MRLLKLLGPAQVEQTDSNLESEKGNWGPVPRFRSRYAIALLGYLAVERRAVDRDYLAALLRPEEESGKGRSNLRRELYNLTKILPECWETDAQSVRFLPGAHVSVDIYLLGRMERERRWPEAADLLSGEFLEGLYLSDNLRFETWLLAERRRWKERARVILANARDAAARRGNYAEALHYGRRLNLLAPWDEEAHRQVMCLLVWTGQREAALKQFAICKELLAEQLAVEPSPETIALRRQIQEGKLAVPPTPPEFLLENITERGARHSLFVARESELLWLKEALDHALNGRGGIVFLTGGPGRGKTVLMDAFVRQAMKENLDLLTVRGSCIAGTGDPYSPFREVMTMLTGDVEARWSAGTISTEHARRLWEGMPLAAQALLEHGPHIMQVLLTGTALLKRVMTAEPAGAPWLLSLREQVQKIQGQTADLEQSHLFEQFTNVLRAVAEKQPLLLLLDDIQWMDAASIGLLSTMGHRLTNGGGKILLVCAYRPEEIVRDLRGGRHLLAKVLGEFRRTFGDVWLSLSWADANEARGFVDAILDSEPNHLGERFRGTLFEITGGHPLFTVELLRTMQGRGDLIKDADGQWCEGPEIEWQLLPARVEAVIAERIDRLEAGLRQILTVGSVEGETFTAEVIARVQGISQRQLLGHLSQELEKHQRLVREQEAVYASQQTLSRYQFSHLLFQRYLYNSLSAGERRLLHGEIAVALELFYEGKPEEIANQLAHHFLEAGEREKAIEYAHLAARRAQALYAHDEAIQHLQVALDLLEAGELFETRLALLEEIAAVYGLFMKDVRALSYYQDALDLCSKRADVSELIVLRLHRKILETALELYHDADFEALEAWSQTLATSQAFLEARLPMARREKPRLEWVRVFTTLANLIDMSIHPSVTLDTAEGYAQAAVELAERLNAPEELSDALEALGKVYFVRGRLPDQLEVSHRRLALSRDPRFRDLLKQVNILESLSDALMAVGEYEQAMHHLLENEALAIQIDAVAAQVWAMGLQALCLFRLDRWEELFELDERLRELERRYSLNQIGGGNCVVISICAAAHALRGDLNKAQVMREQAYAFMTRGGWDSPEDWERTQFY